MKDKSSVDNKNEHDFSEKGRLRRRKLLSIAKNIVLDKGPDKLVLRQIAKEADVKLGHLQHYFPTRDDLLEAIIYEAWESDEKILLDATSDKDVSKIVSRLLDSWAGDKGKIYLVLANCGLYQDRFRKLKIEIYQAFYDDLVSCIRALHPSRSSKDIIRRTKVITSILDGAMLQVHCGTEAAIKKSKSDLKRDLVKLVSDLILT